MENKEDNSKMIESQLMNQQLNQLQQQLHTLDHQLGELTNLSLDLESLKDQKNAKTFSSLGGGIFIESEIKESKSVLLSVGSNILIKKPKEDAIELVKKQIDQLSNIKKQLESEVNKLSTHMMSLK
jgi:prefoldin alpha subunit